MNYIEVKIQITPCSEVSTDLLSAFLGEIGFDSFVSFEEGLFAYIPSSLFDEDRMKRSFALVPVDCAIDYSVIEIPDRNWNEEWEKNYFTPIVIGNECVVHSSFHTDIPEVKYDILIDPKMSFGTGHHETTSTMMEMMLKTSFENKVVLDMGCGTAILSILASMRGAKSVTGVDIDEWAYENALENIEQFESATENEKTVSSTETETIKNEKKPSMAKNILWIIAAIIISLIVGAVITFIKKKRQTNKFDNDYFDDDDSDADYSDNDSIVEYEEAAEESDITKSTSEIQSNSDDLEEYLDD